MQHHSLRNWEKKLKKVIDDIDDVLEDRYGNKYRLHPARPKRGKTSNKSHDGLFDITTQFTLGLGSEHGKGYVVDIRLSTLENVSEEMMEQIEQLVIRNIREKLPDVFPGKNLNVSEDGEIIKIHGDLSLGEV